MLCDLDEVDDETVDDKLKMTIRSFIKIFCYSSAGKWSVEDYGSADIIFVGSVEKILMGNFKAISGSINLEL